MSSDLPYSDLMPRETLEEAGYEMGDVLIVATLNASPDNFQSTTSTTYTVATPVGQFGVKWEALVPRLDNMRVGYVGFFNPGTGETYDTQFRDIADSVTLADLTGITAKGVKFSGWFDYDPPSLSNVDRLRFRHRTNPGANSSGANALTFLVGMEI